MNLLQALNGSWIHTIEQSTLDKRISFFLALSVDAVVAIGEPVKKRTGTIIWIVFRQSLNAIAVQCISKTLFTVRSLEFEVVSDAHELNATGIKFLFQGNPTGC